MVRRFGIVGNEFVESAEGDQQVLVAIAPDDAERAVLQREFLLDDYDLTSTLDPDEVPRLDVAGGRPLLIWKVPERATIAEVIDDRLVFLKGAGEVSFTEREYRNARDVRDAMLAFLLRTVRHFVGHLKAMRLMSSELEKRIAASMENQHLLQMFSLSESLVYYVDAIEGNGAVLAKLRGLGAQLGFHARHLETLDDLILENAQAARQANIYSSVLSGLMDARGTVVNNNMNVLLKNLTLINIVFLPLNLIASIGGMSEWSVMTQGLDWRLSYALFCLGMLVFGWGIWLFVKKVLDRVPPPAAARARRP
jgi:magnesium transporter